MSCPRSSYPNEDYDFDHPPKTAQSVTAALSVKAAVSAIKDTKPP